MNNITIKPKSLDEITIIAKKALTSSNVTFKSQVVAVFDISGSMKSAPNHFYSSGIMDALTSRVLALGLQLDDDGQIPVYTLGSGSRKLLNLNKENLDSYIERTVIPLVGESTEYAPFINKIVAEAQEGDPMLVLVFTDGDNSDHAETKKAIIEASKLPIFFQWYGIYRGKQNPGFPFLEKLDTLNGRQIDNCGFSPLGLDLNAGLSMQDADIEDEKLYIDMLKEYKDFPAKAQQASVIWGNKPRRRIFGFL